MSDYDYLFKILLIGDPGVGKSSLLLRYVDDTFIRNHIPRIVDFKIRTIDVSGKVIKIQMWDTAGQERFESITQSLYHGAHGIFLVFDVTNSDSFRNICKWSTDVEKYAKEGVERMLIGNKSDNSSRMVDFDAGKSLAGQLGIPYLETSAVNSSNVNQAFLGMVERLLQKEESLKEHKGENELGIMLDSQEDRLLKKKEMHMLTTI